MGLHRPHPTGHHPAAPQGCPSGSVPFRAMQCSLYDNKPVRGTSARYRWVPFHGGESPGWRVASPGWPGATAATGITPLPSHRAPAAPNVCDLNCLAVGHNFYYTFGRALDGTRCSPGSPDLCVGGRCLVGARGAGSPPGAPGTPQPRAPTLRWHLAPRRAWAVMGSWGQARGPTPAASAAAAAVTTGVSSCTGSSRARTPPPVNDPLPRPPPWVNALALGSPVVPSPLCVPEASPGSPVSPLLLPRLPGQRP